MDGMDACTDKLEILRIFVIKNSARSNYIIFAYDIDLKN
jgi:hypothetical protein